MKDDTYRENVVWLFLMRILESSYCFFNRRSYINNVLVDEVRKEAKAIEPIRKTDSDASNEWIRYSNWIRNLVANKNPAFFLRWRPIRETMNVTNSRFILEELNYLRETTDWNSFWKNFIRENHIGGQIPSIFYPLSSGNNIHHSYVLKNFLEKTNHDLKNTKFIFEYGGGYGNLCRLIYKAGFNGKYILYDIPIISRLQKFYLKSCKLPVYDKDDIFDRKDGIFCIDSLDDLANILEKEVTQNKEKNLFIASWSISESPLNVRKEVHEVLFRFGYFLIGYQNKFGEVDNKKYFSQFKTKASGIIWYDLPLKHLPAHNLLIGKMI